MRGPFHNQRERPTKADAEPGRWWRDVLQQPEFYMCIAMVVILIIILAIA